MAFSVKEAGATDASLKRWAFPFLFQLIGNISGGGKKRQQRARLYLHSHISAYTLKKLGRDRFVSQRRCHTAHFPRLKSKPAPQAPLPVLKSLDRCLAPGCHQIWHRNNLGFPFQLLSRRPWTALNSLTYWIFFSIFHFLAITIWMPGVEAWLELNYLLPAGIYLYGSEL